MASPDTRQNTLPTVFREVQSTPNFKFAAGATKSGSKSRIKGRVSHKVLFPPEQSRPPQKLWSDKELSGLAKFISLENDGLIARVSRKDMEFWGRAAMFVQQQAKTEHRRTGKQY